jgi:hypothetical protein
MTTNGSIIGAINRIDAETADATRGPWKVWGMTVLADPVGNSDLDDGLSIAATFDPDRSPARTGNADFIAFSRTSVPVMTKVLTDTFALIVDWEAHAETNRAYAVTAPWDMRVSILADADAFDARASELRDALTPLTAL